MKCNKTTKDTKVNTELHKGFYHGLHRFTRIKKILSQMKCNKTTKDTKVNTELHKGFYHGLHRFTRIKKILPQMKYKQHKVFS